MSVGQWEPWSLESGVKPDIIPWDPSLPYAMRGVDVNRGCPDGYFAQFVGIGEPSAVTVPGKTYALRCRLMQTSNAQTIQEESGTTAAENLAIYTEALKDTAGDIGSAIKLGGPWVVLGLVALAIIMLRR